MGNPTTNEPPGAAQALPDAAGSPGEYFYGSDGAITCACCGYEAEAEHCDQCEDGMAYHDCGEDCCCCADPWPNVPCDMCDGKGFNYYCDDPDCKAFRLYKRVSLENAEPTPREPETHTNQKP